MKTLKAIPYQSGYIFVDGKIKPNDGELVYNDIFGIFPYDSDAMGNYGSTPEVKIIAQYNLNLEGIPYVELEEDVEELGKGLLTRAFPADTSGYYQEEKELCLDFFKEGYKAAQPKKYTEVVVHLSDKGENGFEYATYQKDGKTYLKVTKINYAPSN